LASDEIRLVGPTQGALFSGNSLTPKQLAQLPIVTRESGSGTRRAVQRLLDACPGYEGACVLEVSSSEAARRCILAGAGVGFLSTLAIAEDLERNRLRRIRFPGTPVKRDFYVQRLRSVTIAAPAREFLRRLTSGD
jgi:DNA-binding transcriptional LysR family regulator